MYGKTFKLDDKMDVVFNDLKEIDMIEGQDKVKQDLEVLFRTHLGDDIFAPDFGFDFAHVMSVDTDAVKKRELELAAMKYTYTKNVLAISVTRSQQQEKWSMSLLMLTGEEIKTQVTLE